MPKGIPVAAKRKGRSSRKGATSTTAAANLKSPPPVQRSGGTRGGRQAAAASASQSGDNDSGNHGTGTPASASQGDSVSATLKTPPNAATTNDESESGNEDEEEEVHTKLEEVYIDLTENRNAREELFLKHLHLTVKNELWPYVRGSCNSNGKRSISNQLCFVSRLNLLWTNKRNWHGVQIQIQFVKFVSTNCAAKVPPRNHRKPGGV